MHLYVCLRGHSKKSEHIKSELYVKFFNKKVGGEIKEEECAPPPHICTFMEFNEGPFLWWGNF